MDAKLITIAVGLGLFGVAGPAPARAADLGSDCCSDLEARVATLEAETARKGNRKVSLTISGTLSETAMWTDYAGNPNANTWQIQQNPNNPDTVMISGSGKVESGLSAGFVLEMAFDPDHDGHSAVMVRQTYVYIKSDALGSIRLGHQKMSADGIGDTTIVNLDDVAQLLDVTSLNAATGASFGLGIDRRDAIRYDSAVIGGFQVSGSYAPDNQGPVWDVAADWSGKVAGIDLVAGTGYQDDKSGQHAAFGWTSGAPEVKTFMVSGGIRHELSGLFIQAGYANAVDALVTVNAYHGQAGISKNFFGLGDTSLYGEIGEVQINGSGTMPKLYGFGAVQNLAASSSEVFAGWRRYDQISTAIAGMTIKF